MTPSEARLKLLQKQIAADIPGFRVGFKDRSKLQRLIKKAMFWTNYYQYISTFYPVVWWPTEEGFGKDPWQSFATLAHEYVHLLDAKRLGRSTFGFGYLLPQALAPLGLLMFLGFAWPWLWLLAVFFLLSAPLPAVWRMKWEVRGYAMTMAVYAWAYGSVYPDQKKHIASIFTGWDYYKMWPFEKGINRRIETAERAIHNGEILGWSPAYGHVKRILQMDDRDAIAEASRE